MSLEVEPVGSLLRDLDYEINRLAGTLVDGRPTIGPATAARWWLGDRGPWAPHNLLPVNVATGFSTKQDPDGVVGLDEQLLEVVEGEAVLGNEYLRVTSTKAPTEVAPMMVEEGEEDTSVYGPSTIMLTDAIKIEPWHIYTFSAYTLALQYPRRGVRLFYRWRSESDTEIGTTMGKPFATKEEWNLAWVTAAAPADASLVRVGLTWTEQLIGEAFGVDKAGMVNGSDPAWALPEHGAIDKKRALQAHLNMKLGVFDPERFLSAEQAANRLAGVEGLDIAQALSLIPTPPDPRLVAPH